MKTAKLIKLEMDEIHDEIRKWESDLNKAKISYAKKPNPQEFIFIRGCEDLIMVLHTKIIAFKWVLDNGK